MCDWGIVAGALISAASAWYQSEEQADYAEEQEERARQKAQQAEQLELERIGQMEREQKQVAKQSQMERARQAAKERGAIRASASEAGAFGNVLLRDLAVSMTDEAYDQGVIKENLENQLAQNAIQRKGAHMNADNHYRAPDRSPWLTGLNIGGSAMQGAVAGADFQSSIEDSTSNPNTDIKVITV